MDRKEKKSESLDVRLPPRVKQRFMAVAKARGETASEAVRDLIEQYLQAPAAGETLTNERSFLAMVKPHTTKIAGMTGAALAGAFMLTLIPSAAADQAAFELFVKNKDGVLTPGEIAPNDDSLISVLDTDSSASVSMDEFKVPFQSVEVAERVVTGESGAPVRLMVVTQIDFEIVDETTHLSISRTSGNLAEDASEADREALMQSLLMKLQGAAARPVDPALPPTPPAQPR